MVLGVVFGSKSYPMKKYLFTLMIVFGVGLFMYKDNVAKAGSESGFGIGEILLVSAVQLRSLLLGIIISKMCVHCCSFCP